MRAHESFKQLKNSLASLRNCSYLGAWDDAQKWKEDVREIISKTFSGMDIKNELLEELGKLFVAPPSYALIQSGEISYSPSIPEKELQTMFEVDICTAKKLIDSCIKELERLVRL